MAFHDLRAFLAHLETCGDLKRIGVPVDPELESTSLCLRVLKSDGPALLFERPIGASQPLLGNLFGHRRRVEAAIEARSFDNLREVGELLAALKEPRWPSSLRDALAALPQFSQLAHVAPRRSSAAAFREIVLEGPDVDLGRLPIQRCWPEDAGRLITFGLVVTRGTRQARQNVAIYRQQVIGRNRIIMR
ncbi:MAG: UbiD family decarboxylase, partial [Gammaproteobacteria bacterium]|nr:UbiD family decarboxylase [Gammaproteobacteria bacterium]